VLELDMRGALGIKAHVAVHTASGRLLCKWTGTGGNVVSLDTGSRTAAMLVVTATLNGAAFTRRVAPVR